jgi:hypothetical protein
MIATALKFTAKQYYDNVVKSNESELFALCEVIKRGFRDMDDKIFDLQLANRVINERTLAYWREEREMNKTVAVMNGLIKLLFR